MENEPREPVPGRPVSGDPEAPSLSSERQRAQMLAAVLQDTEAKEASSREPTGPETATTPGRLAAAIVLTAVAGWLWLFPPSFIRPWPAPQPTVTQVEAGLRFAVALQAERILAHRVEARRLPDFLREVGDTLPGLLYRRLDGGTFLLRGRSGEVQVEYRSDEPLVDFVAPALRVLGALR